MTQINVPAAKANQPGARLVCKWYLLPNQTVAYPMQRTRGVVHWSSGSVNHSVAVDNTS